MKVASVILAGGEGRRIGGNKPQRLLGNQRLIDRAEILARRWSAEVAIAVRETGEAAGTSLEPILDQPGIEGPLGGLASALRFADGVSCDTVLTIPADMPFLPSDLLDRLHSGKGNDAVALARSGGRLHPVCGLWSTRVLAEVPDYVAAGNSSLRGLAETVGYVAVDWPVDPLDPFFNINSLQDLAVAERLRALTEAGT